MASTEKKYASTIIYRLIYTLVRLMSLIPFHTGQMLGQIIGKAFVRVPMNRTKTSLNNLRHAFGDCMTMAEIEKLNKLVMVHFGKMFFEVPHIIRLTHLNLGKYVVFQGEENLLASMDKGKGAFILTGHFGNWELMSAAVTLHFAFKCAIVVRPIDFSPADRMISDLRTRCGVKIIPKKRSIRRVIRAVRQNTLVGILLDQNVDWYEGVFVRFLGRPACTNKGLALMAMKTQAPVIPVFSVRQADGKYRIIFEKEIDLIRTGDKTRDVEENTAAFTRIIEKYIRQYPDHWFWFHKRWKIKPFCPLPEDFFRH